MGAFTAALSPGRLPSTAEIWVLVPGPRRQAVTTGRSDKSRELASGLCAGGGGFKSNPRREFMAVNPTGRQTSSSEGCSSIFLLPRGASYQLSSAALPPARKLLCIPRSGS